ncbi:epididymal-specific lipocalin-5-like [Ochotona princeps]|uniref:epididymal-specific lipocalin-5-like n=1 Tax=Ochotona princeps TaxID=9978 RepID=UPI002714B99C|nr:epididymal-specific lipocalin-5-like [Ochotona princeps]
MGGTALLALLGLCLGTVVTEAQGPESLDIAKLVGFWYEIACATKPARKSPALSPGQPVSAVLISLDNGQLGLTTSYFQKDHCVKIREQVLQGDAPRKFKIIVEAGSKDVEVVATDYVTFAILDMSSSVDGRAQRVLKFYSHKLEPSKEAWDKFHQVAQERGFGEQELRFPEPDRQ